MSLDDSTNRRTSLPGPDLPDEEVVTFAGEAVDESFYYASQWQLIWWRFRRHRLAIISVILLTLIYILSIFSSFFSPYSPGRRFDQYQQAPPMRIRLFDQGRFVGPHYRGLVRTLNQETFRYTFVYDDSQTYPLRLFVRGEPYKFLGLVPTDIHFFGTPRENPPPLLLFGADRLGRDIFSRTLNGGRISLSIGLIGVLLSFLLGCRAGRHFGLLRRRDRRDRPAAWSTS